MRPSLASGLTEGGVLGLDVPEEPPPLIPEGGPWVCSCALWQVRGHHDGHLCLITDHFVLNANFPVPNEVGFSVRCILTMP